MLHEPVLVSTLQIGKHFPSWWSQPTSSQVDRFSRRWKWNPSLPILFQSPKWEGPALGRCRQEKDGLGTVRFVARGSSKAKKNTLEYLGVVNIFFGSAHFLLDGNWLKIEVYGSQPINQWISLCLVLLHNDASDPLSGYGFGMMIFEVLSVFHCIPFFK